MIEQKYNKINTKQSKLYRGGVKNDLSVVSCIYLTITNTYQCTPP